MIVLPDFTDAFRAVLAYDPDWYTHVELFVAGLDTPTQHQRNVRLVQTSLLVHLSHAGLTCRPTSWVGTAGVAGPPTFPIVVRATEHPRFELWVGADRNTWGRGDSGSPSVGRRVYFVEWTGSFELYDEKQCRFPHHFPEHWTTRQTTGPFNGRGWPKALAVAAVDACQSHMLPLLGGG